MAKRVSESRTSSTCLPCAAKNSAIVVAASAARMRLSGDSSEVETTTTARARPSAPRAIAKETRPPRGRALPPAPPPSPRPRCSASSCRSACSCPRPSRRRCPLSGRGLPSTVPSMARMPVPRGSRMGTRSSGERTAPSRGSARRDRGRTASIDRRSLGVQHSAHQRRSHFNLRRLSPATTPDRQSECPRVVSTGIDNTFEPRNPITSAECARPAWS